ncbi:MAG TPA: Omp28-related outer membrane protein [Flavobacterium sp.]|nr:Omp28-related outer membrane protein [Flavobacterium sp.]
MKKLLSPLYFIVVLLTVSCSDTTVVDAPILINDRVDAPPVSGQFKKRVLIEDYTGTWCGNCTRVAYAIDQVFEESDKAVSIAIHNGNDPYHFAGFQPLKDLISPNNALELPQSRLNRTTVWTFPEPSNIQQAINLTSNNCGLGLAMTTAVNNGNINLDVKVKFAQNYSNLKLVVYVLENNLTYMQRNYTTYYGAVNPVPNYTHNHVLRASLTDLLGNPMTQTTIGQTVTKSFSVPVPANISNAANISFVAFVVDANNYALNARAADANEIQHFEENP